MKNLSQKPVLAGNPQQAAQRPQIVSPPPQKKWTFSFKYWKQINYFDVGAENSKWFVSLFERLSEMSSLTMDSILNDEASKEALRMHDINWEWKNIPINKSDIDWIPEEYWDKPEYPLIQFHVSKAKGRVAGFIDENNVFNIVLLDPKHNLQPCKFNGHKVISTRKCFSEIDFIIGKMNEVLISNDNIPDETRVKLNDIVKLNEGGSKFIILYMTDSQCSTISYVISEKNIESFSDYIINLIEEDYYKSSYPTDDSVVPD